MRDPAGLEHGHAFGSAGACGFQAISAAPGPPLLASEVNRDSPSAAEDRGQPHRAAGRRWCSCTRARLDGSVARFRGFRMPPDCRRSCTAGPVMASRIAPMPRPVGTCTTGGALAGDPAAAGIRIGACLQRRALIPPSTPAAAAGRAPLCWSAARLHRGDGTPQHRGGAGGVRVRRLAQPPLQATGTSMPPSGAEPPWLDPQFRNWNPEEFLPIDAPILVLRASRTNTAPPRSTPSNAAPATSKT